MARFSALHIIDVYTHVVPATIFNRAITLEYEYKSFKFVWPTFITLPKTPSVQQAYRLKHVICMCHYYLLYEFAQIILLFLIKSARHK